MLKNKKGRIVNNASIAVQIGHPDIWYVITKAGLINATKSYARLLGGHGVIINVVCAGPVETDMMKQIPETRKETMLKSTNLNRFVQPKEIAETATESPNYINGTCVDLNGGAFSR